MTDPALLLVLVALGAGVIVAGVVLARRLGVTPPRWLVALAGGLVVLGAAVLSRRRSVPLAGPPPSQSSSTTRRTAGDILSERASAEKARREEALAGDDPEGKLAELGRAKRRRP